MDTLQKKELALQNGSYHVFDGCDSYTNNFRMYFAYYNKIPNYKSIDCIDLKKFKVWFEQEYQTQIIKEHHRNDYFSFKKKLEPYNHLYFLENEILINVAFDDVDILYDPIHENRATALLDEFKKFIRLPKRKKDISLIIIKNDRLETHELHIKKPKIDFDLHYNVGFLEIHKCMIKQLNTMNTNGLYLFHGQPGTGKSTYIKYLIHLLRKKVIFISPKMAGQLDNISMTPFLLDNRNTVFVIEDAEELITSRDDVRNSNLSMLLNLTDGLLGESLGIQIIATFNTDVKNIDKALLRKGRLSTIYEFKLLSLDRTNALLKALGHTIELSQPLTAADIFNFEINTHYEPKLKKAVGFGN